MTNSRRNHLIVFVLAIASVAIVLPGTPASAAFTDVPAGHWASGAISYVAVQNDWLQNFGTSSFRPEYGITRRHLARALVLAFPPPVPDPQPSDTPSPEPSSTDSASPSPAPTESPTPEEAPPPVFSDLGASDYYYPYAASAVQLGWMTAPGGKFNPGGTVAKWELDLALVNALGLADVVAGLKRIATVDGYSFRRSSSWAAMVLASELRFHYNHNSANERRETGPATMMRRSDAAYALQAAAQAGGGWRRWSMQRYATIALPKMSPTRRTLTSFALLWAGYPYVYGGEWYKPTPSGYCCGAQAVGGFDCSGFSWWVLKASSGAGWAPTLVRPYKGYSLPQRTSYDMARTTTTRIVFRDLLPMDVMLFKSDLSRTDWPAIDHVGLYLGNGWMIHSSGGRDGVTISWAGDGWWRDHFMWGRRVVPGP